MNTVRLLFDNHFRDNYLSQLYIDFILLILALVVFQGTKGTRGYPGFPVRGHFSTCPLEGMPDWPLTNQNPPLLLPWVVVAHVDCGNSALNSS